MWKDSNKNGHSVSFFLFGYPGDLWPFNRFYWNRLNFFHRENKQVPRICGSWSCILQSFLVFSWAGTCLHTKYSCFQSLQVNTQNVIYWILWHFWFTKRKNCESLWLKALSLAEAVPETVGFHASIRSREFIDKYFWTRGSLDYNTCSLNFCIGQELVHDEVWQKVFSKGREIEGILHPERPILKNHHVVGLAGLA